MYEKNTSLIDSDINCRFEDLLCMTPDEFRSWVSKMRKLVIDIWDEHIMEVKNISMKKLKKLLKIILKF